MQKSLPSGATPVEVQRVLPTAWIDEYQPLASDRKWPAAAFRPSCRTTAAATESCRRQRTCGAGLQRLRGLGLDHSRREQMDARSIFQERSGIRAVEPADSYRGYQLRVKVPKIDAMLRAGSHLKRLPVSDAAAMPAADRAQSSVALDVGLGRVGMAFDLHRSEREVHPGAANRQSCGRASSCSPWRLRASTAA